MYKKIGFIVSLIVLAAASRLLPHPPNFTPIAGMALFGGAVFLKKKWAFAVPLGAMLLSDILIGLITGADAFGFHSTLPAVYLTFAITVCMGFALRRERGAFRVGSLSLAASLLFFVITNLAVWAEGIYYEKTVAGLWACFTAAIPFFHYTVLGDALYVTLLFGAMAFAEMKLFRPSQA
jgi:hypothetical protein